MNRNENKNRGGQQVARQADGRINSMFPMLDAFFPNFLDLERFFPAMPIQAIMPHMRFQQPAVNISENDTEYQIEISAPGMRKEDFQVEVVEGRVLVSAGRSYDSEEDENNNRGRNGNNEPQNQGNRYTRREFGYSQFSRSFALPSYVVSEQIDASYQDGILRLIFPKREDEGQRRQRRQIDIK